VPQVPQPTGSATHPSSRPSTSAPPLITTLGALRASGHLQKPVKVEIRDNLLARLRSGEPRFPGIVGFDDTVLPHVERALLAGHDFVLLGERGQGPGVFPRGEQGVGVIRHFFRFKSFSSRSS